MPQIASSSPLPQIEMKDTTAAQRYETFTGEALQHQLIEYMWRSRIGDNCPDMKPERLLCAYKAESVSPRKKIKFKPTFMEGKEEEKEEEEGEGELSADARLSGTTSSDPFGGSAHALQATVMNTNTLLLSVARRRQKQSGKPQAT